LLPPVVFAVVFDGFTNIGSNKGPPLAPRGKVCCDRHDVDQPLLIRLPRKSHFVVPGATIPMMISGFSVARKIILMVLRAILGDEKEALTR
jgi:hypothetical protein